MTPYFVLLAVAFLWGCSTSQLNLLAVVLRQHGMAAPAIAVVLSATMVAVVAAALVSGALASRIGARRTLVLGGIISFAAIAALPFAVGSAPLAVLARAGQGVGFGLFTPAGQLIAKSLAREDDQIRAVGRFTAMFLIPTFFGPALGEWSLRHWGEGGFFLLATAPIALGLLLAAALPHHETPAPPNSAGYLALLRDRRQWVPNAAAMQSGIGYGFAASFLPLMLVEYGVPVAGFFTPFAVILLATRFLGLNYLQRLPVPILAALGLAAYAMSFGVLAGSVSVSTAVAAGCLAALGYAVIHPTCIEWSSRPYPPAARARPVALINTTFNFGSIVAVQAAGSLLPLIGWRGVLIALGLIVLSVLAIVSIQTPREQWRTLPSSLS